MFHGQPQFMCISSEVVSSVEFTFSITNTIRLKAPYESNCLDYTSLGYIDRSHFVETCYANKTIETIDRWPFFLETSSHKFKNIDSIHFAKMKQDNHPYYYFDCSESSNQANCNYTQFEIKLNQVNFCHLNVKFNQSILKDYLIKNLTDLLKQQETNEKSPFFSQIERDHKKNELLLIRQRKLMESNSCDLKQFLIVVQFTDDYITDLEYAGLVEVW